ncbi:MAG: RING finger domain-containing protein [Candidatus Helarchaeota archaeon]
MTEPNETCHICRRPIQEEDLGRCAYCHTAFHRTELNAWIKRHGTCPRCQRELKLWAD